MSFRDRMRFFEVFDRVQDVLIETLGVSENTNLFTKRRIFILLCMNVTDPEMEIDVQISPQRAYDAANWTAWTAVPSYHGRSSGPR